MEPKYPNVSVELEKGEDGNPFMVVGHVRMALKRAGVDSGEIDEFSEEALSGDYDNVLQIAVKWVDVS